MKRFAIGIDLGGTSVKAALVERGEGATNQTHRDTDAEKGPDHVIDVIVDLVKEMWSHAPEDDITGIGIGAPGNINWERTTLSYPPNLHGWKSINLKDAIQQRLGAAVPIIVENDANVAGLGSAHYGAGRPYDSFIMMTLGTGVGGAIIYNNKIFRGTTGSAGEIGHMSIDYEGPYDRSGVAGSIEAYLGQNHLSEYARERLLNDDTTILHGMTGPELEELTPKMLYDAAVRGDQPAIDILAWAGHKLGCVMASVVHLLDIRTFIVGGGVSAAGDFILEPARRTVKQFVMPGMRSGLEIIQESLGNQVGILGAAHVVFQYLDDHDA